jgi:hypothetical protein
MRGELPIGCAAFAIGVLVVIAPMSFHHGFSGCIYLLLNLAYSLTSISPADVFAISAGFVLRVAGSVAIIVVALFTLAVCR